MADSDRAPAQKIRLSGARISEALALTPASIDVEGGVPSITTLKRRKRGIVRQVPLPHRVLTELNRVFDLRRRQRHPVRYRRTRVCSPHVEIEPKSYATAHVPKMAGCKCYYTGYNWRHTLVYRDSEDC
jgi:integrase